MAFVVMTRECSYGGCNCSCFETDEVYGPFTTEKEAETWGKKHYKFSFRIRGIQTPPK